MRFRSDELTVDVTAWGADQASLITAAAATLHHPTVQDQLRSARYRVIATEQIEPERKSAHPSPQRAYRTTIVDYSNNRTLYVTGSLVGPQVLELAESGTQPLPNAEEFNEAVGIVVQDGELGPEIQAGQLQPYAPMPPLVEEELPDGRMERVIAVGLRPSADGAQHEIVGVNMAHQRVVRFPGAAPPRSLAGGSICGLPNAGQATAARTASGAVRITIRKGGVTLWRLIAVRPAASSGTNGSGLELRFVDYRGKRVLYRAHVPILNVRYDRDACGPYRDWQWEEGMLQANGTDVAPGFRFCPAPAQTLLDSGTDTGNFLGVAIYVQGQEVVLVSEMQAGWYRYISEWRLHTNGTIQPRFGFGAVQSSCVCNIHHHHVYWRFDFDIRTPGNNIVREYNNPPLIGGSNWHSKHFEIRRPRDAARHRHWRVENSATGEGYNLIPGASDGDADSFGVGDMWALRYHGSSPPPSGEVDDGQGFTTDPVKAMAHVDNFLTGESIDNQDVVIWYAAHFTHDVSAHVGHIVGPELTPHNW